MLIATPEKIIKKANLGDTKVISQGPAISIIIPKKEMIITIIFERSLQEHIRNRWARIKKITDIENRWKWDVSRSSKYVFGYPLSSPR